MANPAFSKDLPRWWAWIVGSVLLSAGGSMVDTWGIEYGPVAGGMAVAFVGGWAWQTLNRRDLADRLVLLSWLAVAAGVIYGVMAPIPGVDLLGSEGVGTAVAFPGLIAGLVLCEQWQRKRD